MASLDLRTAVPGRTYNTTLSGTANRARLVLLPVGLGDFSVTFVARTSDAKFIDHVTGASLAEDDAIGAAAYSTLYAGVSGEQTYWFADHHGDTLTIVLASATTSQVVEVTINRPERP